MKMLGCVIHRPVMYSHTPTCTDLDSLRLRDISVLPDEKAPCQSLRAFRGRSRGLCDLFMTLLVFLVFSVPGLCARRRNLCWLSEQLFAFS